MMTQNGKFMIGDLVVFPCGRLRELETGLIVSGPVFSLGDTFWQTMDAKGTFSMINERHTYKIDSQE
jgi:hypothetical protein